MKKKNKSLSDTKFFLSYISIAMEYVDTVRADFGRA